jgi:catalase-peroxidase
MAMNDEETVALIAGGHTFGKVHGAHKPSECVGPEPAAADIEQQGLGWQNQCGKGNAEDTVTSGLEGAWTAAPTRWTMMYLQNLFNFEWEQTRSPAGAIQWVPKGSPAAAMSPDAHVEGKSQSVIMLTTDLSLKEDPKYRAIAKRFLEHPEEFEDAFARAWFKLTHRDMGPTARYLGGDVPEEALLWQDPLPAVDYPTINEGDVSRLKAAILATDLSVPELVRTAWAAAASYRGSDMRGGANGARLRLAPQKDWPVNNPEEVAKVIAVLEEVRKDFNADSRRQVSLADLIVLGGAAAVEKAAAAAGHDVEVPFAPGRADATAEQTDPVALAVLEPKADGFRNYYSDEAYLPPAQALVDRADLLTLTVPEMTALVGGLRVLNANTGGAAHGVFTDQPGTLSNDFFVNLLDMNHVWSKSDSEDGIYEGRDRSSDELKWTATPVDLIFGSNAELRAVAEVYASSDGEQEFVNDFIAAWTKVMQLDRFDL